MAGSKLHFSKHREDLNSNRRIASGGRFKRALRCAVLAAGIMVASMGTKMKAAAAQSQRTADSVQQQGEQIAVRIAEVWKAYEALDKVIKAQEQDPRTPVAVGHSNSAMVQLISAVTALNRELKAAGLTTIPISGNSRQERFRSLNRWLKRGSNDPFNRAAMDLLEVALLDTETDATQAHNLALGAAAKPKAAAPAPTVTATTVPQPTAKTAKSTPVKKPVAEQKPDYRIWHPETYRKLQVVAEYGKDQTTRDLARDLITKLNAGDTDSLYPAEQLVTAEFVPALKRKAEAIAGDSSYSQQARTIAGKIAANMDDVWLVGEYPRELMLNLYDKALKTLKGEGSYSKLSKAKREKAAASKVKLSQSIFDTEQKLYRDVLVKYLIPMTERAITMVDSSSLPTFAEWEQAETDHAAHYPGFKKGSYAQTSGGHQNGKKDLKDAMEARLAAAKKLAAAGHIPFRGFADLYQAVTLETRTLGIVISLWEYGKSHGVDKQNIYQKSLFYEQAATAIMKLADPDFDPYPKYSKPERLAMASQYLHLRTGETPNDQQVKLAEQYIVPVLMTSKSFGFEAVVQRLYAEAVKLAGPSSDKKLAGAVESIALLRSMRPGNRLKYQQYQEGSKWVIQLSEVPELDPVTMQPNFGPDGQPKMIKTYVEEKDPNVNKQSPERLVLARTLLQKAIEAAEQSGMDKDDKLLKIARARLNATSGNVPRARIPTVSDTLYNMAMGLASIREAQLWRANPKLRRKLTTAERKKADAQIAHAIELYVEDFSVPSLDPPYHSNQSRIIANSVIRYMAPRSFDSTEASATYNTIFFYDNPDQLPPDQAAKVPIADSNNPTVAEREKAAAAGEEIYLRFLLTARGKDFGNSPYDSLPASLRRSIEALEWRVGRAHPAGYIHVVKPKQKSKKKTKKTTAQPIRKFRLQQKPVTRNRTSVSPIDEHFVEKGNKTNPLISDWSHEDVSTDIWGQAPQEVQRLITLHGDDSANPLLRRLDIEKIRLRFMILTRQYAKKSPQQQLVASNEFMISILDMRIRELELRLQGKVKLKADGKVYRRVDLADSASPEAYCIKRAQNSLKRLKALRTRLIKAKGTDLYTGADVSPREGIAEAERAITSLDDDIIPSLLPPENQLDKMLFYVPAKYLKIKPMSGSRPPKVQFVAERVYVNEEGKGVNLTDFESREGLDVFLTYYWFPFQSLGLTDSQGRHELLLRNHQFQAGSTDKAKKDMYVGMILYGTKYGDVVVRVREAASQGESKRTRWEPVVRADQVQEKDILFRVRMVGDTPRPIDDKYLRRPGILPLVAAQGRHIYVVPEQGETFAGVIVRPHGSKPRPKKK